MKPSEIQIEIELDADVLEKTKILAEKDNYSVEEYIKIVIREHLENSKSESRP